MPQDLTAEFPDSDWISATAALAQYNLRNFDEAQELYEDLLERDPHRIDVSGTNYQKFCQRRQREFENFYGGSSLDTL